MFFGYKCFDIGQKSHLNSLWAYTMIIWEALGQHFEPIYAQMIKIRRSDVL